MTSGFEESADRRIKITLEDEQGIQISFSLCGASSLVTYCSAPFFFNLHSHTALHDYQLLIKLSYASSYIKDGDVPLDRATLIRLASLAEAHEFRDAVTECMAAAGDGLDFEEAIACINDDLPDNLCDLAATKTFRDKAMKVLLEGLSKPSSLKIKEAEEREKLLKEGSDALAIFIGPVADLCEPNNPKKDFTSILKLKDPVKVGRCTNHHYLRLTTCFSNTIVHNTPHMSTELLQGYICATSSK